MIDQTHLLFNILSFFGAGILLAFTPCVLPMVPILSAILVGQENKGTLRAFQLSLTFVLSMAFTYAGAGLLVGYLGSTVQTALQLPWVIVGFSLIFVVMAMSMFGVFNLNLPRCVQNCLQSASSKQKSGSVIGVAIMGVLATLIASPCVTPPLISVLTYISQTGNALFGGIILFSLALGMGLPLLLFGIGQGVLLPKSGEWMNQIKYVFGIMMLGLAIWMVSRLLPGVVTLFLWAILLIVSAIAFGGFAKEKKSHPLVQGISFLALIYGILLLVGAASGNDNVLKPLASVKTAQETNHVVTPGDLFMRVNNITELQKKLQHAKENKRPVMIEFFASWCPSCRALDANVLSDPTIQKHLQNFMAIRVDITNKNPELMKLIEYYHVYGTPTMLFYDRNGQQINSDAFNETETTVGSLDQMLLKLS